MINFKIKTQNMHKIVFFTVNTQNILKARFTGAYIYWKTFRLSSDSIYATLLR